MTCTKVFIMDKKALIRQTMTFEQEQWECFLCTQVILGCLVHITSYLLSFSYDSHVEIFFCFLFQFSSSFQNIPPGTSWVQAAMLLHDREVAEEWEKVITSLFVFPLLQWFCRFFSLYIISVFCQFCYHKSFFISFQFLLTFQTDEDLIEKFLSQRKEEPEPEKNVVDTTQDSKGEPFFSPQTMNQQLLCQRLVFERDAFLHPSSILEGSVYALLDPNFLQDQDPNVEQVSSLLTLASEKVTQGYKLL